MYSIVKLLWHDGVLRSREEIHVDQGLVGELRLKTDGAHRYLGIYQSDHPQANELAPLLLDPSIEAVGRGLLKFRGFEWTRHMEEGECTTVQEWAVRVLLRPGEEMPKMGLNPHGWLPIGEVRPDDFLRTPGAID
jgi:hypothetical protein